MSRYLIATALLLAAISALPAVWAEAPASPRYPDRWVFLFGFDLTKPEDVVQIEQILETAAAHGMSGAVLPGFDALSRQPNEFLNGLEQVKRACERLGIELIPSMFGVGYGSTLGHNRNLAEGFPVEDALFEVRGTQAWHVPELPVGIPNGDFEAHRGDNTFTGFGFQDGPGVISSVDREVAHSGKSSLRMENFATNPYGHGRINVEVKLRPYRCYRVSAWVKTEDLRPASNFRLLVLADGRDLGPRSFNLPPTGDWRKVQMVFNSMEHESALLYAGIWDGKSGRFWLDDWTIEEIGPVNLLRRPGTPIAVKSEDGSVTYEEGRDFGRFEDLGLHPWRDDREPIPLHILPQGRIKDGDRLRVSWYHSMIIYDSQVGQCMAEPEMYEIWEREAKLALERTGATRVLMNQDEIRQGGTCAACQGKDMAKLLGECITKGYDILKAINPGVQVLIWSDMLDPNHNAHGDYYLVRGDFTGSWNYVPKDLVIAVWGGGARPESLRFFADEGFRTLVACYYDADSLDTTRDWLKVAETIPGVQGFMYTTWERKYGLLGEFGEEVGKATRRGAGSAGEAVLGVWAPARLWGSAGQVARRLPAEAVEKLDLTFCFALGKPTPGGPPGGVPAGYRLVSGQPAGLSYVVPATPDLTMADVERVD